MDSSLNNTLVAAVAFAATFLGVRAYAYFKARSKARRTAALSQLLGPTQRQTPATSVTQRPLNRSKRKRMDRQSSSR